MTPDARDRAVAEEIARMWVTFPVQRAAAATQITAALATARAEEREACVAVVESLHLDAGDGPVGRTFATMVNLCAAALRARGEG